MVIQLAVGELDIELEVTLCENNLAGKHPYTS